MEEDERKGSMINWTIPAATILHKAIQTTKNYGHEYVMPEHLLWAMLDTPWLENALLTVNANRLGMIDDLEKWFAKEVESDAEFKKDEYQPSLSDGMQQLLDKVVQGARGAFVNRIAETHLLNGLLNLEESMSQYVLLTNMECEPAELMSVAIDSLGGENVMAGSPNTGIATDNVHPEDKDTTRNANDWHQHVECLNDTLDGRNPLIGRELELERTIQVLCRKEKNNPLHIGEPGVGKTALVYGLARMIEDGRVPSRLKGSRIYRLDLGGVIAGTQYRGDFEKKLKSVMEGARGEEGAIIYIDEIHNLVGAGATGEGSMDASNMLKPYLEAGDIRFIGATTYEEYKRYFAKSKSIVRRFSQIDIDEPSLEEALEILCQLQPYYEKYHGVVYDADAIEFAVKGAARHMTERYLPDKAIDLIDEAGAYRELHPDDEGHVTKELISEILSKVCKVEALAVKSDDEKTLETLAERVGASVYGQEEAVRMVTEAVQMGKAGLTEEGKPLASLLFVGPTGVGKTEVAKVLAKELGIELVRFDMSEYTEKHTVAKLIGSPAGYVGYEDGGLLTDAIRKTPNCVLLLDEIEKAHSDIYNILLQVMDYASLTDSHGRKADFRNVVMIMTSNAGAQHAAQATVGFGSNVTKGVAMMKEVKKLFKPEFLNRLSGTVIFRDMDRQMAALILEKKLRQLESLLKEKDVRMTLAPEAFSHILDEGYSNEYGAREMDRVISSQLKPLLMRAILFGGLKNGGDALVDFEENALVIRQSVGK